jgi:ABC-type antimicrobial peptide transport system permease subunit
VAPLIRHISRESDKQCTVQNGARIPFNTMDVLQDNHYLGGIWLDFEGMDHEKLTRTIRDSLAIAHKFKADDQRAIFVFDAQKQLAQFNIITMGLKILLTFIGTITLAIGGIGLMNIMLVSVTQRTREIGVEKALSPRRKDILFQFLAEALVITAVGGVLGVVLSNLVLFSVGSLTLLQCDGATRRGGGYPADCRTEDPYDRGYDSGGGRRGQRNVSGDAGREPGSDRGVAIRVKRAGQVFQWC